jgi:hypothetical protein
MSWSLLLPAGQRGTFFGLLELGLLKLGLPELGLLQLGLLGLGAGSPVVR